MSERWVNDRRASKADPDPDHPSRTFPDEEPGDAPGIRACALPIARFEVSGAKVGEELGAVHGTQLYDPDRGTRTFSFRTPSPNLPWRTRWPGAQAWPSATSPLAATSPAAKPPPPHLPPLLQTHRPSPPPGSRGGRRGALSRPARTGSRARPRGSGTGLHSVQPPALRVRGEELTTKLRRGQAAKRADRRLERLVSLQLFAPDASVRGARPCAQIHPPTLSMPHTYAGCRYHAWQRTPAHAPAFLQRLDHCASSSSISSSGEHSTGQIRPELDTTLTTIVRVLALLTCLKFQVIS